MLKRRKFLRLLGAALLAGCEEMTGSGEKGSQNARHPDHGKTIARNGKEFRVFVLSGIRFEVPVSHPVEAFPQLQGMYLHFLWPDIPPGSVPGTTRTKSPPDKAGNSTTNLVEVQVFEPYGSGAPDVDQYIAIEEVGGWSSPDYDYRDDVELGLRLFTRKNVPQSQIASGFFGRAYSLDNEVLTPHFRVPVVVSGEFIKFVYAPGIHVRIAMRGWSSRINPNWRSIYLGVVQTLNNYRESDK